jgi:hypothetical protein
MDHRHLYDRLTGFRPQFISFTQTPGAIEPADGALHHPAFGDDHKALDGVGTLRNLQPKGPLRPQRLDPIHQRPGIRPIRPDVPQPRKLVPDALEELLRPGTILDAGGGYPYRKDPFEGIAEEVTRAAFALFARVVAPEPPFSVGLTDCLSSIAALGGRRFPAAARTSPRSRSCMRCQVPSCRQCQQY